MKYIVTGSEGFLGKAVCRALLKEGNTDLVKVDIVPSSTGTDDSAYHMISIDETSKIERLCRQEAPDAVINLAGTFVKTTRQNFFDINCFAPVALIEACAGLKCRFVLMGSAAEYGYVEPGKKVDETLHLNPVSEYGIAKACQTQLALRLDKDKNMPDVVIARPFNIIGAGISESLFLGAFAMQIAKIEKGMLPAIMNVGNLDSYRDLVPVAAAASWILAAAKSGGRGGVYNICSGVPKQIGKILEELLSFSQKKIEVKINADKMKKDDIAWSAGDNKKITQLQKLSITDAQITGTLKETLDHFRGRVK